MPLVSLVSPEVIAALAQSAAERVPRDPFFTNDFTGILKVLGFLGTLLGITIGFVVRVTSAGANRRIDAAEVDITNVGGKVDRLDAVVGALDVTVSRIERSTIENGRDIGNLRESHGEIRASLDSLMRANTDLHRDISTLIRESATVTAREINALAIKVAEMGSGRDERKALAEILGRVTKGNER